jgi:hypothetical protein
MWRDVRTTIRRSELEGKVPILVRDERTPVT